MLSSRAALGGAAVVAGWGFLEWQRPAPIVMIGGGVMGLGAAWKVGLHRPMFGPRVVLFDENHPIRGSWGESRASAMTMNDPVLLRMSLNGAREYLQLQERYRSTHAEPLFFRKTGRLFVGPQGTTDAIAQELGTELANEPEAAVDRLSADEVMQRFPQIKLDPHETGLYMDHGYVFVVNTTLEALKWACEQTGAVELCIDEPVTNINRAKKTVTTQSGRVQRYSRLVICSGPWTNKVLSLANLPQLPMVVSNEQNCGFREKEDWPEEHGYGWSQMPLFTWSFADTMSSGSFYCVPYMDDLPGGSAGVKIGYQRQGPLLETKDFQVSAEGKTITIPNLPHERKALSQQESEVDQFGLDATRKFLREKLPGLNAEKLELYIRCLYQCTPDCNMMVGPHPADPEVSVACGFTGNGFQFAPIIGRRLAELSLGVAPSSNSERKLCFRMAERFRLDREWPIPGEAAPGRVQR